MNPREAGPFEDSQDAQRTAALLADLRRLRGSACGACAAPLCGHASLFSIVAGFRDAPLCFSCLAAELDRDAATMRDHLVDFCRHKECYSRGFLEASRDEGDGSAWRPRCLFPPDPAEKEASPEARWDAGDMGCGDLVLELRQRLARLQAGAVLRVTATDPGAPEDLPAWCNLTGNPLVRAQHPDYWIRRKER
ncbi:MAG: sulfurtransferase TusA family protein [Planctomycetaceae bacterium]